PEVSPAEPVIDVARAEPIGDAAEQIHLLDGRVRRHENAERLAVARERLDERAGRGLERLLPRDPRPLPVDLDHRVLEAVLGVEAVAAEAVAIRDPRLVDRIVGPRHDALHATAQHMRVNVRADTVMGRDERHRAHLPRPRAVAVRLVVQRADRAEVDDVAGKLVPQPALDVRAAHDALGTADRAELLNALDLGTEAHAAG